MKKFIAGIIFGTTLLFCFDSFSQSIKNFTSDPVKFPQELETFFTETNKKQGEELMDAFNKQWEGGKFSAPQQDAIYRTTNSMLRKRMKAFPDFANYISTLTGFAETGQ